MSRSIIFTLVALTFSGCQALTGPDQDSQTSFMAGPPAEPGPPPGVPGPPDGRGQPDDPGIPCEYGLEGLDPRILITVEEEAGEGSFQVGASNRNCAINVATSAPWLTLSNAMVSRPFEGFPAHILVEFSYEENLGHRRTGFVETDGGTVLICQVGANEMPPLPTCSR